MAHVVSSRPRTLLRLTSLRALAAVLVFGYHLGRWHVASTGPFSVGYTGVAFFFILSGFVLAWGAPREISVRKFYRRRFARIYPNHIVMWLVAAVVPVTATAITFTGAAASLLLVQAWYPDARTPFAMNGVSWSLSCEAFFYAALPFVLPRLRRVASSWRWVSALMYFTVASALVGLGAHYGGATATVMFANPLIRFGEFLLGVVAGIEMRRGWRPNPAGAAAVCLVSLGAAAVLPRTYPVLDVYLAPVYFTIIVMCASRDLTHPFGWLTNRWLLYAGEVSFAFYLVHELVILNVGKQLGAGVRVAALDFVLACIAAVALHHLVERPCQRWIGHKPTAVEVR